MSRAQTTMPLPTSNESCRKCGAPLGRFAAERVCARCLLEAGLSDSAVATGAGNGREPVPGPSLGRFGHYELLEEIGHGGMGLVYRARDTALHRSVALKLILAGQFASEREVKRFRTEAEAAARLDHPNIVPIYEVGEQDGRPFFSMKFMEGGPLTERLAASTAPIDSRQAVSLLVKIARAVHHAHQRAILHRDLKPGNILLDGQGEPHVSDFGLAKCLDDAGEGGLTLSGATLGSPSYMSPEQASGHPDRLTTATDTYSLGALFYHLLTNRPPFEAATPLAIMEKVLRQEPVPPRVIQPGIDTDLETICLKCLEKDPQHRYASADALAEELERWLRGEPIQARPCSVLTRLVKWTRRQPGVASLVLLSSLAILALLLGQAIMSFRLSRANTEGRATNTRLSASLYELRWRKADEASRAGERDEAIAWLGSFLRQNPNDSTAAARLLSLLSSCNFPVLLCAPLVHDAPIGSLDFGATGARLATASGKTVRLWNVQSGQVEMELSHPAPLVQCVLGGERDRRVLTISAERKARLWDLDTQQIIREIVLGPVDGRRVGRNVLLACERRLMAINLQSNVVAVLDAASGAWAAPPLILPAESYRFTLSEDGRLLAAASRLGVQLWDVTNRTALFAPVGVAGLPMSIRFSGDSRWLACSGKDRTWVMNTVTGVREREFSTPGAVVFVNNADCLITRSHDVNATPTAYNFRTGYDCGSPFGRPEFDWLGQPSLDALRFSFKSTDRLHLLDPATGRPQVEPFVHDGWIVASKLHPAGRIVATGSQDRTARIWSVEMGVAEPLALPVGGMVWEAQWSPSGDRILSTSVRDNRSELRLWHVQTGTSVAPPVQHQDVIYFAQWAPDGSRFATGSQDLTARLWHGETGEPICPPLRHDGVVTHCAFSPDGTRLATAADDRMVRLWDGRTGKAIGAPLLHSHQPLKVDFSRDGRHLATASQDGTIRVWSVPDPKLVLGPLHHDGTCWVAAFSPDGRLLVSTSSDGTARLWDATTGQPVLPPFRHEGPVLWASFSPNGRAIATSTESGVARVWDTATGQPLSESMRHPGAVWFVKWSPDGRFLATTCTDGSARIWDAFTGHRVAEPFSHQPGKEVRRAEFSADGHRLLTASFDGTAKVWDLSFLRPPVPVPDWLPDLAEALGGKRIGAKEAPEAVAGDRFQGVKHRLTQAPGPDDYYARWAKWMIEARLQRPVQPFYGENGRTRNSSR